MTGLSALIGSWKIIASFGPRIRLSALTGSGTRSVPSSSTWPWVILASAGRTPSIARSVMLLPEPDGLAPGHLDRHSVHRPDRAAPGGDLHVQVAHLEHRPGRATARRG